MPTGSRQRIGYATGAAIAPRTYSPDEITTAEGVAVPMTLAHAVRDFFVREDEADAVGGEIRIEFGAPEHDEVWLIDHILITSGSATPTTFALYVNGLRREVGPADAGNRASFVEATPVVVQGGEQVVAVWAGASAGATGRCVLTGRVAEEVSVPL